MKRVIAVLPFHRDYRHPREKRRFERFLEIRTNATRSHSCLLALYVKASDHDSRLFNLHFRHYFDVIGLIPSLSIHNGIQEATHNKRKLRGEVGTYF